MCGAKASSDKRWLHSIWNIEKFPVTSRLGFGHFRCAAILLLQGLPKNISNQPARQIRNNIQHSRSMLVVASSGVLYQILQWRLGSDIQFSLHQIAPLCISHVPSPPPPPPRQQNMTCAPLQCTSNHFACFSEGGDACALPVQGGVGKTKSLLQQKWKFGPTAAMPTPSVDCTHLRTHQHFPSFFGFS